MIESSIIIPVYNNWQLTRQCLKSLSANTKNANIEIIAVDNASTDATEAGCPFLGRQLFGEFFRYIRNDVNRNFAGACNQGALAASGEFVIFLNNDTEVQPGWYEPLMADFAVYPDLGATGPLLVYPEETPLGRMVQHLGVVLSPLLDLVHLYEGIPAISPLARKRRFFQAITGACMALRRELFLDTGMFDERFVNGFEDLDLCVMLRERGLKLTVNPDAMVIHHESQSEGRYAHEKANAALMIAKNLTALAADWGKQAAEDGLRTGVNDWGKLRNMHPEKTLARLRAMLAKADPAGLLELLKIYPYWQEGWNKALEWLGADAGAALFKAYYKLFRTPEMAFRAYELGAKSGNCALMAHGEEIMRRHAGRPENFLQNVLECADYCVENGREEARDFLSWAQNYQNFKQRIFPSFARQMVQLAHMAGLPFLMHDWDAYSLWFYGKHTPDIRQAAAGGHAAFSILMPVYNPAPEHFRAALDSVLAQTHDNWELCLADDASSNAEIRAIIREYAEKDGRIRFMFRERNGGIAQATNSALELARHEWSLLVDQDDLLEPEALAVMAAYIDRHPDGMLFYSDEDKVNDDGALFAPYFKNSKWDWDLLTAQNFVCHLAAYRTDRLRETGGILEGFEGSQDHDLVLRYATGLDGCKLIHVPYMLYHWRVHGGSTALDVSVKGYAMASARKAVQDWLDGNCPGAHVDDAPMGTWVRVIYPVPASPPLASIICVIPDRSFDAAHFRSALAASAAWPHEVIFTCQAGDVAYWEPQIRDLPDARLAVPDMASCGVACLENAAVKAARGEITGFMAPYLAGASRNWLREIASTLLRPGVGSVGGKVILERAFIANAGYMFDASRRLKPFLYHSTATETRYIGWDILTHSVDAINGDCLFTKKEFFTDAGGLNGSMGSWRMQDYCLRLAQKGLRTVWQPNAQIFLDQCLETDAPDEFTRAWRGEPFNKNVIIYKFGSGLCTN